jgi:hypothetical protein
VIAEDVAEHRRDPASGIRAEAVHADADNRLADESTLSRGLYFSEGNASVAGSPSDVSVSEA